MNTSPIVVDASVALRWLIPDALSKACWQLYDRISESNLDITVPALWQYEITSSLARAVRMTGMDTTLALGLLAQAEALGCILVLPDEEHNHRAMDWALKLERASAYDCYYLALAEILKCEFWTADRHLFNAVDERWIHSIDEI